MMLCKIRRLQRAISEYERELTERYSLTLNEGVLLCALREHGTLCASNMAQMLDLTMSNTSKVIRSVEDKGLLKRELCATDKRQMCFSITDEGRSLLDAIEMSDVEIPPLLLCAVTNRE